MARRLRDTEHSINRIPSTQDVRDVANTTEVARAQVGQKPVSLEVVVQDTGDQQTLTGLASLVTNLTESVTRLQKSYVRVESNLDGLISDRAGNSNDRVQMNENNRAFPPSSAAAGSERQLQEQNTAWF